MLGGGFGEDRWDFGRGFASVLAEVRVSFWWVEVTWLGSALGSGSGSGSVFGFTDEKSVRRGFSCSCSVFGLQRQHCRVALSVF